VGGVTPGVIGIAGDAAFRPAAEQVVQGDGLFQDIGIAIGDLGGRCGAAAGAGDAELHFPERAVEVHDAAQLAVVRDLGGEIGAAGQRLVGIAGVAGGDIQDGVVVGVTEGVVVAAFGEVGRAVAVVPGAVSAGGGGLAVGKAQNR